jgi:putative tricarboxylic transport membrane protein
MSKLWAERLTAIWMIVVAGFFVTESMGLPGTSGTFPLFTEYTIIILALIMILRTFITRDKKLEGEASFDFSYDGLKPIFVMIVAIFYGYAVFRVGFYVTSILFYFLVITMTGYRNLKVMGAVAVVLFPIMYLVFDIALDADLPEGFLI